MRRSPPPPSDEATRELARRLGALKVAVGTPNWDEVDYVVGMREPHLDLVQERRSCARCGHDVFVSALQGYPTDVPVVCTECALEATEDDEEGGRR